MRLIDADALKELIPTTSVDMFENCRNCSLLSEEQVLELIDMTPTVDMWIPCSERLPGAAYDVLVCFDDGSMGVDCVTGTADRWEWSEKPYLPIAWMPLPEPWKGENHETD